MRARVAQIQGISGHADRTGLLDWLGHFQRPAAADSSSPTAKQQASLALAEELRTTKGWNVTVPEYQQVVEV